MTLHSFLIHTHLLPIPYIHVTLIFLCKICKAPQNLATAYFSSFSIINNKTSKYLDYLLYVALADLLEFSFPTSSLIKPYSNVTSYGSIFLANAMITTTSSFLCGSSNISTLLVFLYLFCNCLFFLDKFWVRIRCHVFSIAVPFSLWHIFGPL